MTSVNQQKVKDKDLTPFDPVHTPLQQIFRKGVYSKRKVAMWIRFNPDE